MKSALFSCLFPRKKIAKTLKPNEFSNCLEWPRTCEYHTVVAVACRNLGRERNQRRAPDLREASCLTASFVGSFRQCLHSEVRLLTIEVTEPTKSRDGQETYEQGIVLKTGAPSGRQQNILEGRRRSRVCAEGLAQMGLSLKES